MSPVEYIKDCKRHYEEGVTSDCCNSLASYRIAMDQHVCAQCRKWCEVTTVSNGEWLKAVDKLYQSRMKKVS